MFMKDKSIIMVLMEQGKVKIVDREYIGTASDGVEVLLGQVGNECAMLRYLADHPSPNDW